MVAQVSDVNDPEGQGRVTLTFPWLSDDYVSDWARTLQPGAGKGRGAMVVPEVGDEVLVAFEQGDLRRPYVLGGLYNGVDTAPDGRRGAASTAAPGAVNRRSVRLPPRPPARPARRGRPRRRRQLATADDGLTLVLDATGTPVTVHTDGTVLVEGSKGVTVDAGSSALDLKGGSITLTATTGVTHRRRRRVRHGQRRLLAVPQGRERHAGGQRADHGQGRRACTVRAGLVRIN